MDENKDTPVTEAGKKKKSRGGLTIDHWTEANNPRESFRTMSPEEQRAIASAGGKKSAENKQKRKQMKEALNELLQVVVDKKRLLNVDQIKMVAEEQDIEVDAQTAMLVAMVNRVITAGDVRAAEFIRDTVGEKPVEAVQVEQTQSLSKWSDEELKAAIASLNPPSGEKK